MKRYEEQLDERSKRILKELVSLYCLTGEPVGSRTLSKKTKLGLSPATIRNVLADLEQLGYISQPHTSAGRVPTDQGYRFYVNHLMRNYDLNSSQKEMIESQIQRRGGDLQNLLLLTTELMSHLSHSIALAVTPNLDKLVLENIEFVQINSCRVLTIVITRGGVVSNKVIDLDEPLTQAELTRIANYIKSEFNSQTLPTIRKRILDLMKQEQTQYDQLIKRAMVLGQKILEATEETESLVVTGAAQLVHYPEFANIQATRGILEALEEKSKIVRILTKFIEGEGIHILIGSENGDPELKGLSLISSPYRYHDEAVGTLGILGPTRMEYGRVVPLVEHIAKVVSNILSREN
ncbi:heat-inducible transcriptional repressor HrcA [bacterium]|nr:heat-inducible transcriptional repressor HrcA [bacterium]